MNDQQTIFRAVKTGDFTTLSNAFLRDKRLSFKARGMMAMVLSNVDAWQVHQTWIEERGTEGREAIRSGMAELEVLGYVRYDEIRRGGKFMASRWTFHETPVAESERTDRTIRPSDGKPSDGKPSDGNPSPKKDYQKEDYQKERAPAPEPDVEKPKKTTFSPPTLLQVTTQLQKLGYKGHAPSEAQAFIDHHEARGWMMARGVKMKNWEAAVGTWKRNSEKFRPNGAAQSSFLPQQPVRGRV